jgi:hypothetical protein
VSEGGIVFSVMVSGDGEKDFLFLVFYFEPIPLYPPSLYKYLGKGELIRKGRPPLLNTPETYQNTTLIILDGE